MVWLGTSSVRPCSKKEIVESEFCKKRLALLEYLPMVERFREKHDPDLAILLRRQSHRLLLAESCKLAPESIAKAVAIEKQVFAAKLTSSLIGLKEKIISFKAHANISNTLACAYIIDEQALSLAPALKTKPEEFIMYFDITTGLTFVADSLRSAEREISGDTKTDMAEVQAFLQQILDPCQEEEIMIHLFKEMDQARKGAQLLIKDPTGFLLVDETLAMLKGEKSRAESGLMLNRSSSLIPEFVIAGAEMGVTSYKKLFALCPPPPKRFRQTPIAE